MNTARNIRLQYLTRFSLSKDGKLYEGDREYSWRLLGNDVVASIRPSNCRYPKNYTIQELYLKAWGTRPHMSIVNRIRKSLKEPPIQYRMDLRWGY